ncbi:MAG: ice-binding family protein [Candidatus Binatia bacterium]
MFLPATIQAASLPPLGTAANFAVLGASEVTNTGGTIVIGDLGVSPGSAVTGFPPGSVVGTIYTTVASPAGTAQADALVAYNDAAGQDCDTDLTGQNLGGLTLTPGVYCFDSSAQLTGTLTLDFLGDSNAVFIFQMGSTLTTASDAAVVVINGTPSCSNITWQVGSSATLGSGTAFMGNILALVSITVATGASSDGSLYALTGAVTMDTNAISACNTIVPPVCATNADCGDGNVCTTDTCDPATDECVHTNNVLTCNDNLFCTDGDICADGACTGTPVVCVDDGNVCTTNECDEVVDACVATHNTLPCDDAVVCTEGDVCSGGACDGTPVVCTDDGNVCTTNACDESTGLCAATDNTLPCDDAVACTEGDVCSGGACAGAPVVCTDDGNVCTTNACNESTGLCAGTNNTLPCDDALTCTEGDVCSGGACAGAPVVCTDDGNVCTTNACNESTGLCASTNNTLPCDDALFCTEGDVCSGGACAGTPRVCGDAVECTVDACNEDTNQCEHTADDTLCEDDDVCTTDTCNPLVGCEHEPACTDICRTPGYWGTHGGYEKTGFNVTQAVLDSAGGIEVCGELITTTSNVSSPYLDGLDLTSALEGLCVRVQGQKVRQLYRQLVATALNCQISSGADCDEILARYIEVSFSDCNALCADGGSSLGDVSVGECIEQLDCFNNGGLFVDGACVEGGGCHEEALCNEELGICPSNTRASSPRACQEATSNRCTIDSCN